MPNRITAIIADLNGRLVNPTVSNDDIYADYVEKKDTLSFNQLVDVSTLGWMALLPNRQSLFLRLINEFPENFAQQITGTVMSEKVCGMSYVDECPISLEPLNRQNTVFYYTEPRPPSTEKGSFHYVSLTAFQSYLAGPNDPKCIISRQAIAGIIPFYLLTDDMLAALEIQCKEGCTLVNFNEPVSDQEEQKRQNLLQDLKAKALTCEDFKEHGPKQELPSRSFFSVLVKERDQNHQPSILEKLLHENNVQGFNSDLLCEVNGDEKMNLLLLTNQGANFLSQLTRCVDLRQWIKSQSLIDMLYIDYDGNIPVMCRLIINERGFLIKIIEAQPSICSEERFINLLCTTLPPNQNINSALVNSIPFHRLAETRKQIAKLEQMIDLNPLFIRELVNHHLFIRALCRVPQGGNKCPPLFHLAVEQKFDLLCRMFKERHEIITDPHFLDAFLSQATPYKRSAFYEFSCQVQGRKALSKMVKMNPDFIKTLVFHPGFMTALCQLPGEGNLAALHWLLYEKDLLISLLSTRPGIIDQSAFITALLIESSTGRSTLLRYLKHHPDIFNTMHGLNPYFLEAIVNHALFIPALCVWVHAFFPMNQVLGSGLDYLILFIRTRPKMLNDPSLLDALLLETKAFSFLMHSSDGKKLVRKIDLINVVCLCSGNGASLAEKFEKWMCILLAEGIQTDNPRAILYLVEHLTQDFFITSPESRDKIIKMLRAHLEAILAIATDEQKNTIEAMLRPVEAPSRVSHIARGFFAAQSLLSANVLMGPRRG